MFIDYSNLKHIVIHHDGEKYIGEYHTANFMVVIADDDNDLVFKILSIKNKYEFIRNVVGYTPKEGKFPRLRTKEDFIKVLDALNKEYDKHFGNKTTLKSSDFVVGEKVLVRNDLEIGKKYGILTAMEGHISLSNRNVSFKAEESKNSTISINDFIKSKKHYQLNFNN